MERIFWWSLVFACALVTMVRALVPEATSSAWLAGQQFAFGTAASIATGATVVLQLSSPARLYATQKRVAVAGTLFLGSVMVVAANQDRFQAAGAWILLPVAMIGPVLYLRDFVRRSGHRRVRRAR